MKTCPCCQSHTPYDAIFCGIFFQAEDGIRDVAVTGVQTCALPISRPRSRSIMSPFPLSSRTRARSRPARRGSGTTAPTTSALSMRRSEERRVGKECKHSVARRLRPNENLSLLSITHPIRCHILWYFFSSRRRHTRCSRDWSSDVCSSDLAPSFEVDYEPLPSVVSNEGALAPGAPRVWNDCPDNLCFVHEEIGRASCR